MHKEIGFMFNETRRAAWVEVDLGAIRKNFSNIKSKVGDVDTIPAIKGDGYGHGSVKVAWELLKEGATMLGVSTMEEAVVLREAGINTPIVLFSLTPRGNVKDLIDLNVIPVVSTYEDAIALSDTVKRDSNKGPHEVFVALETGMGRVGITNDKEGLFAIKGICELDGIKVKGIFSHFATADEKDPTYALSQIEKFNAFEETLKSIGLNFNYRTMANSAAVMNYPQAYFSAVRPGIALYGQYPSTEVDESKLDLTPAMSVKANIVYLKKVPAGFSVSYGKKFTTTRESLIGTLPLGYADGLPRFLSGKGRVIVNGVYAPIAGNICMDQCMVDLTDVPGVKEYDEVILMGKQGDKEITATEIGEKTGTINYEVCCRFGQRLPKVYV